MRKLTVVTLLILTLLLGAGPAPVLAARPGPEVWLGAPQYGPSLAQAVAALGPEAATLRVPPGDYHLTDNCTIPNHITLKPERGAVFHLAAGRRLYLNGGFEAGLHRVFAGEGYPVFRRGAVTEVYPQWFGAAPDYSVATNTGADNTAAFQKAINAMMLSCQTADAENYGATKLKIPPGQYLISGTINLANSAQNLIPDITHKSRCPFIIEGSAMGSINSGGTILYKGGGGFCFLVGGDYHPATNSFTLDPQGQGAELLQFRDFTICSAGPTWSDAAALKRINTDKPKGIGGTFHRAKFANLVFNYLYIGLDTYFSPTSPGHGIIDYASLDHCQFLYITYRGAVLMAPDATVLNRCGFVAHAVGVDDTQYGGEPVSACGLAVYNGDPVLVGCGFNYYGYTEIPAFHDYAIFAKAPYSFNCYGVHAELGRFLYATTGAYPDLSSPAHLHSTINIHGGSLHYLKSNGINIYAAGKVRFTGTGFWLLKPDDPQDLFNIGTADVSLEGVKFWRPTGKTPAWAEFAPVITKGPHAAVHLGDVAGARADLGVISNLNSIGGSQKPVNYAHYGNRRGFGALQVQSGQLNGRGPQHLQLLGSKEAIPAGAATPVLRCTLADGEPATYQITVHYRVWAEHTYRHGAVSFVYGREAGKPAKASALRQAVPEQELVTSGQSALKGLKWSLSPINGGQASLQLSVDTAGRPTHLDYRVEADGGSSGGNTLTLEEQ